MDEEEQEALSKKELTRGGTLRFPELLSISEMKELERQAIESGTSAKQLMESAGTAVAEAIGREFPDSKKIIVLAGLGSNGGDGYVAARLLLQSGLEISVYSVGDVETMTGIAGEARDAWLSETSNTGITPVEELSDETLDSADLVIDAIFGIGLSRELSDELVELVERINDSIVKVVSVDVPSGLDADSGNALPIAVMATTTVTFFRAKTGHFLFPGRDYCGRLLLEADIGLDDSKVEELPTPRIGGCFSVILVSIENYHWSQHKYDRGHVLVISGGRYTTGASRLAAYGASRSGAGLVTIAGRTNALDVHANHVSSIMLKPYNRLQELQKLITEELKVDSIVVGPGLGENAKNITRAILELQMPTVLDADSLTAFEKDPSELLDYLNSDMVLTPHEGEFKRLFPDLDIEKNKLAAVERAAESIEGVVVLKGADTIISMSEPAGTIINDWAPPWLATAGSGDVLAGVIGSLIAQEIPPFLAAAAGVWLHGEAGYLCGGGSNAEDFVLGVGHAYQFATDSRQSNLATELENSVSK